MAENSQVADLNQGAAPHAPEVAGGALIANTLAKVDARIAKKAAAWHSSRRGKAGRCERTITQSGLGRGNRFCGL